MLIPIGTYVLVADGSRWALFRNTGPLNAPRLELIDEAEQHVERTSAMGADHPGRSFQSMQVMSPAYETTDYHQQAEDRFAASAAERLERALSGPSDRGVLIAAPRVLGFIRDRLGTPLRGRLIAEISKDYANTTADDLAAMLERYEQ